MKRVCEICGSKNIKKIYTQKFLVSGYRDEAVEYNVVICRDCGFAFAQNPPSEKRLASFYKKNIKYAYKNRQGNIPEYAQKLHKASFKLVDFYLREQSSHNFNRENISILDIGCGSGYLLHLFKSAGYKKLLGLDPAEDCRKIGKSLYDLEIITSTLSEFVTDRKFDVILLGSVLEHMGNLPFVVTRLQSLVKSNGTIFATTPDGDNFSSCVNEPFLEFSLEHINFFTRNSIANLFSTGGFQNISFASMFVSGYGGYALNSLWKKSKTKHNIKLDSNGESKIEQYIHKSLFKLEKVKKIIHDLLRNKKNIVVWGVGSLTSRLLATTKLAKLSILFFVDNNQSLQGTRINNIKIVAPSKLKGNETILVSSYIHGNEIKKGLLAKRHCGKVIILS